MERKEGLKPCVFCGRTNQRFLMDMDIYEYPQNRGRRAIICDCGLRLYARDYKEAEEKWQNRLYDEYIKELIEKLVKKDELYDRLAEFCEGMKLEYEQKIKKLTEEYESMAKSVGEASDLIRKMQERLKQAICDNTYPDFNREGKPVNIWKATTGYDLIDQIAEEMLEGV